MVILTMEYGFALLRGRRECECITAPWWPCSGAALRKVASHKLPKEFVDECARFADSELTSGRY